MAHGISVWLLDLEDLRVLYYWELQGARLALSELARKYWRDLPEHVQRAVKRALNDLEAELYELEAELAGILPDRSQVLRAKGDGGAEGGGES